MRPLGDRPARPLPGLLTDRVGGRSIAAPSPSHYWDHDRAPTARGPEVALQSLLPQPYKVCERITRHVGKGCRFSFDSS
jgi:hypothetical protein